MITIAAVVLSVKLGAAVTNVRTSGEKALCGLDTTTVVFTGNPGTTFTFDGERFVVPANGSIELVAGRTKTYEVEGQLLPVNAGPADEFGRRTVQLPATAATADASLAMTALPRVQPRQ